MDVRAVIERMGAAWIGDVGAFDDLLADDVVVEVPFAPGGARRWVGRQEWLAFAGPARAGFPVRFDRFTEYAVHLTADPEVTVVEYELGGEVVATGKRGCARFIGVLRVRDGRIAEWREYQDTAAIRQALG
jgi:ketosteroid isomerase-like protein